jgi:hypothetical protein
MWQKIIACMLFAVFAAGCISERTISSTSSLNKSAADELMFIDKEKADSRLKEQQPNYSLLDQAKESLIVEACSEGRVSERTLLPALVPILMSLVVTPAADWFVGKINDEVQKDLQGYTNIVNFSGRTYFYTKIMEPNFSCLRMRRSIPANAENNEKGEAKLETVWDFVAQIRLTDSKDAIQLRPLRLYYSKAFYEKATADDTVGVVIGLKADAVWKEGNVGKKDTVLNIDTLYQSTRNLKNDKKADYPFLNNPLFIPSAFISGKGEEADSDALKMMCAQIQKDNLSKEPLPIDSAGIIAWLNKLIGAPDLYERVVENENKNLKSTLDQKAVQKHTKDIIDKFVEGTKDYRKDEKNLTDDQKKQTNDMKKSIGVLNRLILEALYNAPSVIKWDFAASRYPMIPFSYDLDRKPVIEGRYVSPPINITVTVHETSAAPWLLKVLAENLDKNKKTVSSALSDYVKKQIPTESTK